MSAQKFLVVMLANAVLDARCADDQAKLEAGFDQLSTIALQGYNATVPIAMTTWLERLREHMFGGQSTPKVRSARTGFVIDGTFHVEGSAMADTSVPDEIRWAARLVRAYLVDDIDTWMRIYKEVPRDDEAASEYVFAVLDLVAGTIGGTPYGFANQLAG